jgi:N-glycosylase/DNA lyase
MNYGIVFFVVNLNTHEVDYRYSLVGEKKFSQIMTYFIRSKEINQSYKEFKEYILSESLNKNVDFYFL